MIAVMELNICHIYALSKGQKRECFKSIKTYFESSFVDVHTILTNFQPTEIVLS